MSILEQVNQKKSALNAKYTEAEQAEKIQEYKSMLFSTIDDCSNYTTAIYNSVGGIHYAISSMKTQMNYIESKDLYVFALVSGIKTR